MGKFQKNVVAQYTSNILPYIKKYRTFDASASIPAIREEAIRLIDKRSLEQSYRGVLLSFVKKALKECDNYISRIFMKEISWDGSHSSCPTIFHDEKIGMLNIFVNMQHIYHQIQCM